MSVLSQYHSIRIDQGICAPGHGKEVVDGINAIEKCYMYHLISNVQLPGSITFDSHILMHYWTPKIMSVCLNNSKNICLRMIVNMQSLIRKNTEKCPVKENGRTESIISG